MLNKTDRQFERIHTGSQEGFWNGRDKSNG